ncbi:MAG: hypothetical protein A2498_02920 [Lentisphaerae bacterium RIFOXYC12_FULL_60_16]|nr:MAG: hypothetical protein A2498_02920 [Lentisphaerae bacterium RIFOXYC12_FULL_60_16]OGV83150.1 MAG: hypothetical protein A2340_12805 [Lentisphaerae bacterium RIFOXYB12_FULL_60_10]
MKAMVDRIGITSRHLQATGRTRVDYTSGVDGLNDWTLLQPGRHTGWIVVLHGHGSDGNQVFVRPDIRDTRLPIFEELGYGVFSPNLRGNAWMSPSARDDLHAWLDILRAEYGAEKFFFISGSMGGTSNLIYAAVHPQDVAGVVALCPATDLPGYYRWCFENPGGVKDEIRNAIHAAYGGSPAEQPKVYDRHSALRNASNLTMPVVVIHGDSDPLIPVGQSRRLAESLRGKADFQYLELPGAGHDFPQDPVLPYIRRMLQPDFLAG